MVIQQIDIYNYLYFKKNSNKKNIWIHFTRLILTYRWVGKHLVCKLHNFLVCADFKMIPLVLRTYGLSLEFSWQNTSWLASFGIVTAHMSCSVFQLVKWCLVDLRSSYRHGCCISNLLGEILFFFYRMKVRVLAEEKELAVQKSWIAARLTHDPKVWSMTECDLNGTGNQQRFLDWVGGWNKWVLTRSINGEYGAWITQTIWCGFLRT